MLGQAIITIKDNQWAVSVAVTYADLVRGLSGVTSIPPGTGMLFILPSAQAVTVTTQNLYFPIDIIFVSDDLRVIEVAKNVPPGMLVTENAPVGYFLEVNSGEATDIESGDTVNVTLYQPATNNWITPLVSFAGLVVVGAFMTNTARNITRAILGEPKERERLKLLPQTAEITKEEWQEAEGMWEVTKEDAERGEVAGVYLWSLLTKYYPDNKDKQIRLMGFMGEVQREYGGRIPRDEAWKLAKKWDVEKVLTRELLEFLPQVESNPTRLDGLEIVKAFKQISRHGEDKISVSLQAWAIFPRGKRPHFISMYRSGDEYVIQPLYAHIAEWVRVPVEKVKAWIKSLPVRHFEPMAVAPQLREEAERLAKQVDEPIDIIPLPSKALSPMVSPITPSGTCYEDAWRYLFKEGEGELIHGTVFSKGKRIGHAWVKLPTGYIWEPQTRTYYSFAGFNDVAAPQEEHRYTKEEAAIMAARTKNFGPWTDEERERYLTKKMPAVIPTEPRPRREGDLEYLADSPEFLTQTIEAIGYRNKLDTAFQEAIARAKGLK